MHVGGLKLDNSMAASSNGLYSMTRPGSIPQFALTTTFGWNDIGLHVNAHWLQTGLHVYMSNFPTEKSNRKWITWNYFFWFVCLFVCFCFCFVFSNTDPILNMEYFDFCFLNFGIRVLRYISTWWNTWAQHMPKISTLAKIDIMQKWRIWLTIQLPNPNIFRFKYWPCTFTVVKSVLCLFGRTTVF